MGLDAPRRRPPPAPGAALLSAWSLALVAGGGLGCGAMGPEADPGAPAVGTAPSAAATGPLSAAAPAYTAPAPTAPAPATPAPTTAAPGAGSLPLGAACGGTLGACDETGFCRFPAEAPCGDAGVAGVCSPRPRGCRRDCPGVCGCDGQRFCNTCSAQARGFSVRHRGACAAPALDGSDPTAPSPTPDPSAPTDPTDPEAAHAPQ